MEFLTATKRRGLCHVMKPVIKMAKTAAERKADQRKREAEYLEKMGAEVIELMTFSGTRSELDQLKAAHEFEEDAEVITILIHNVAKLSIDQQRELLAIPTR